MRRYVWGVLFAVVLITPLALRLAIGAATRAAAADAKGAHVQRLIVLTPHAESIRTEFAAAFSAWHQQHYGSPVLVDYRIYGGASDMLRYFQSAQRTLFASLGTYNIDIVWGGGDDFFERLRTGGYLQPARLSDEVIDRAYEERHIHGRRLYDLSSSEPQWFGTALSSFGIVYNRDVLKHLGVPEPRTWSDLRDPRLRGWIVLADPTRSRVALTAFMIIVERAMQDAVEQGGSEDQGWVRGMGLIRQIAANARIFSDSGTAVPAIVASGDGAAGMAIDFQARSQVDAIQTSGESRLAYIEPAGATAITVDPVAMVRGAEHPELAARFIEFLLSEQGQRLLNTRAGAPGGPKSTSLRRLPVMKSVYASPRGFTDTANLYATGGGFNTDPRRTKTSAILAELVQMSCIDLLDELRQTRLAILASPRAAELDARLGAFPFDQPEALRRAQQWQTSTPLQRIELQRRWTGDFREEYRRLLLQARQ